MPIYEFNEKNEPMINDQSDNIKPNLCIYCNLPLITHTITQLRLCNEHEVMRQQIAIKANTTKAQIEQERQTLVDKLTKKG